MLGAITGDIIGSVFEFRNYKAKDFQPLFQPGCKFTDDTICTIAIADALLNDKDPAENLKIWGREYWSNGGWGQSFARWLASENSEPYNSYGNGAAMRVSACAWLSDSYEQAIELAILVTEITHNHPEGIKGALATTSAIYWARSGITKNEIRRRVTETYGYDLTRSVDDIRANNPHSEASHKTVPEAITCAVESTSFEDAIRNAISIGGDSDTIACIAGGIAEAFYGGVPEDIAEAAILYLPHEIRDIVENFYQQYIKDKAKS